MCHSPSGAFRVHAPDRACWAPADTATATDSPAASPPDTTFCAKRFITDLREKGDSVLTFTPCCSADRSGGQLSTYTSRAGPGQYSLPTFKRSSYRRPALDCREHPPAERARRPRTSTSDEVPLDGFESAIGKMGTDRASLKQEPWELL